MAADSEDPIKADEAETGAQGQPHPAKVGVKDLGQNVSTVAGEAVDGRIADIADGDS